MTDEKPVSLEDRINVTVQAWADNADEHEALAYLPDLIERLHVEVSAGADFTPPEQGTEHTPAQALAYLLDADQHTRLAQLAGLLRTAGHGADCLMFDHAGQIQQLQEELGRIPESWRRHSQMLYEAEQFVQRCGLTLSDAQRDQVRMSIAEEIERTT